MDHMSIGAVATSLKQDERRLAIALRRFADELDPVVRRAGPAGEVVGRWLDRMRHTEGAFEAEG